MHLTTQTASTPGALALSVAALRRSRPLTALVALVLVTGLIHGGAPAAAREGSAADLRVGHRVERVVVPGAALGEPRQVDVHLWYPADARDFSARSKAVYTSALHEKQLYPDLWDPLSWIVEAELAREGAAIDPDGGPFPVIVFSHGSTNDPIDYAHTLERIATGGFVVAAPSHTNNTQDDARIDFINGQAAALDPPRAPLFPCNDGRPASCSRPSVPFSMADRARDVSKVLDELPAWFGSRVDVSRAGVMGHSRGTVTALAAAGGSVPWRSPTSLPTTNCVAPTSPPADLCWPLQREPRVKAIMGMAIGAQPIIRGVDLASITVPTLLIAGKDDANSLHSFSVEAYGQIPSADKTFVSLDHAVHRSFDSTYCAQLQSAGAAFDGDGDGVVEADEVANKRRILDRHTVGLIAASAPGGLSGKAVHYCAAGSFTAPVNIEQLVASISNAEYACTDDSCGVAPPISGPASPCVTTTIPCTGLDTDQVMQQMAELAVEFFGTRLERDGDGVPDAADNCPGTPNADQADADSDGAGDACDATPQGTIPPTIAVPEQITVDATGPAGATVAYTVTASDDIDPAPVVRCTPSAGSLFAIGDTSVECVATDAGGNTANASFTVSVLGASEQLARLIQKVVDASSLSAAAKRRLIAALQSLTAGFDPNDPRQRKSACLALRAFTTVVRSVGPPAQAAEWTADANRIRAVLAC
jgi:predicted dienelactone hydrolase